MQIFWRRNHTSQNHSEKLLYVLLPDPQPPPIISWRSTIKVDFDLVYLSTSSPSSFPSSQLNHYFPKTHHLHSHIIFVYLTTTIVSLLFTSRFISLILKAFRLNCTELLLQHAVQLSSVHLHITNTYTARIRWYVHRFTRT